MKPFNLKTQFVVPYLIVFFVILLTFNFSSAGEQQFTYLAQSFLAGKLHFIEKPLTWTDSTLWEGKYFWPLGPFPAVLLMPFVALFNSFGLFFSQGFLQIFLVVLVFFIVYRIAKHFKYSSIDSVILASAFCFASVFLGVSLLPWSWWFSQVITVLLLFLAIYEYLGKKRYWLIGIFCALLVLTRPTASLVIVFFLIETFFAKEKAIKLKNITSLLAPYFLGLFLLGFYNFARFGNFFDQGYSNQILTRQPLEKARSYGLISPEHIPGNIYYFLLSTPIPVYKDSFSQVLTAPFIRANPWGMSIFITSPYLIYMFFLKYGDRTSKAILFTVAVIALPIFMYYGVGLMQLGYRYSLDFLPLLFLLLMRNFKMRFGGLTTGFTTLVIIFSLTNLFFFLSLFFNKNLIVPRF